MNHVAAPHKQDNRLQHHLEYIILTQLWDQNVSCNLFLLFSATVFDSDPHVPAAMQLAPRVCQRYAGRGRADRGQSRRQLGPESLCHQSHEPQCYVSYEITNGIKINVWYYAILYLYCSAKA